MYLSIVYLHVCFAILFSLFILFDRIYIRNFLQQKRREVFYKKSKYPLLIISIIIVFSGIYLLFNISFSFLVYAKVITATLLLYGFFNCPFYMKNQTCEIRKFMYRFGVVILLFLTILIGIYLWLYRIKIRIIRIYLVISCYFVVSMAPDSFNLEMR